MKIPDTQVASGSDKKSQDTVGGRQSRGSGRPAPMCSMCSRNHWGDYANRACFKCEVTGHLMKDFP